MICKAHDRRRHHHRAGTRSQRPFPNRRQSGTWPAEGSRNRLAEDFIGAFAADFAENGVEIIEKVRQQSPEIYLKLCGDLLPRDLAATLDPGAEFRALETDEQCYQLLAERMVSDDGIDGSLALLERIKAAVLAVGAEQAAPMAQIGAKPD